MNKYDEHRLALMAEERQKKAEKKIGILDRVEMLCKWCFENYPITTILACVMIGILLARIIIGE